MYKFYSALLDVNLKNMRLVDKSFGKWDHVKAAQAFFGQFPHTTETLDFLIMADECGYIEEDLAVSYFVKDAVALDAIDSLKIDKVDLALLLQESELFTLAFPYHADVSPVMVTISDIDDFQRRIKRVHPEARGTKGVGVDDKYSFHMVMKFPATPTIPESYSRLSLPLGVLGKALQCKTNQEFADLIPLDERAEVQRLTPEETAMQFRAMQFVARFLVYRAGAPDRFADGCPSNEKSSKFVSAAGHRKTFSVPALSAATEHYRCAHFRQLRAERYYTGEHKDKPVGSRIVFVTDSVVNARADDIKTVEEKT